MKRFHDAQSRSGHQQYGTNAKKAKVEIAAHAQDTGQAADMFDKAKVLGCH